MLCSLGVSNRRRLCKAVFTSQYFSETRTFSIAHPVDCNLCVVRTVSFQTEYGLETAAGRGFREMMLHCSYEGSSSSEYSFSLSYAYESNQIFVYVGDGKSQKLYPETLMTNARLMLPRPRRPPRE